MVLRHFGRALLRQFIYHLLQVVIHAESEFIDISLREKSFNFQGYWRVELSTLEGPKAFFGVGEVHSDQALVSVGTRWL